MFKKIFGFYWLVLMIHIKLSQAFIDESKTEVKVGALFFRDEDAAELSFDEAFRELNSMKLFELKFVTIKRYVSYDDSFMLQQLTCELIANGVAAIFGPSSKASSDIVALIANTTGLPHMQYDWNIETDIEQRKLNHHMTVNVAPPLTTLSRAYLDIIKTSFGWKKFTLYYETKKGLTRLQDLMDIQTINRDAIKLRNIADFENDIRVLWKEAEETFHENRLIMDCEPESLVRLMKAAKDFKLLGPFRNWFLTHLDSHSSGLQDVYNADFKSNITSVRLKLVEPNPYERRKTRISLIDEILANQTLIPILMYDAVILYANAARNIISNLKEYHEPYKRCGFSRADRWYIGSLIVQEMKEISEDDVEPPFKTESMKIDQYGQRSEFNLEIYKPTVNEPIALWKSTDGSITPIKRRQEFQSSSTSTTQDFSQERKTYTVVSHYEEPYFMLKKDYENFRGSERFEGYAVDLIRKLSEIMEFEYEFVLVNSNGKFNPQTKQWDGIMRKLIDHQAQIGICDLTITQLRRKYVDFTVPFMQLGISILFYKADPQPKDMFAFLQPFAKEVWYFMILTQLVITLLFVFMARISSHEWESTQPTNPDPTELENAWRTRNTAWLMIGSIMQQGCDILPKGAPMRILSAMWWFFALMMLSTYTANLAAFLTSNRNKPSINSLQDLIDQDTIKFGTFEGGSTSLFFSESNDTDYHKAWNQMKSFEPSAFTSSNKEGVERVRKGQGNYAFLMETTGLLYNIERDCYLQQIGGQIGEKHYGLAVPLGADYRTNLSVSILQLSEKGELYKLKNKWWKNTSKTCDNLEDDILDGDELSLIELGGVFLVLAGGIVVAIVIGICEFLWNVQRVAVEEMVTPGEAFKAELIFVLKFWITKKPNRISSITTTTSSSSHSSRSNSRRSSSQSKQSKHSKHSNKSRRSKRSKRSRSRSKSRSKHRSSSS
ncbi:glutamate receptor ionotropic, kainate 2 [Calliphora vicina]|uniref:glutamate receptor ionotropic, kainate 2 n=1 Tax=Calliphora vicina TaxID=7373 RepID=UPI00325B4831